MTGSRASVAIIRRQIDRAFGIEWFVRFAIFAAIGAIFAPLFSAGVALFAVASVAPLAAASEDRQAQSLRRISFFAMPLYGRQLARAHAVAPCITALAAPLGFLGGLALRTHQVSASLIAVAILANAAGALVALSAVFRDGPNAWLYYALTVVAGTAIAVPLAVVLPFALVWSFVFAVVIGFLALRAFGETLARYDPLPS